MKVVCYDPNLTCSAQNAMLSIILQRLSKDVMFMKYDIIFGCKIEVNSP